MRDAVPPFDERLRIAKRLLEAVPRLPEPPVAIADQAAAAARDGAQLLRLAADRLSQWPAELGSGPDAEATMLAALAACEACLHLRRSPVQASVALLAERRLVCARCAATVRRRVVAADACDVCEEPTETENLAGVVVGYGGAVVVADTCPRCVALLDPNHEHIQEDTMAMTMTDPRAAAAAERERAREERKREVWSRLSAYKRSPRPPREAPIAGCMLCGVEVGKRASGRLRSHDLRATGQYCSACDQVVQRLAWPEAVAERAIAERAPFASGWRRIPSAILALEGGPDEYDTPENWRILVWSHYVQQRRAQGLPDPKAARTPFSWLNSEVAA